MHEILAACATLPPRTLTDGEVLITEGARTGTLAVLIDGRLLVSRDGAPINLVDHPGAVIGEISALLNIPHTATVQADGPATVYVLDDPSMLLSQPAVLLAVSRLLAERVYLITEYLTDLRRQYSDSTASLGLVDEVLGSLLRSRRTAEAGSDREPNPQY